MTTHLLYLHGFRSSPRSFKAQMVCKYLAAHAPEVQFWCPQLPPSPAEAMALVADGIAPWPQAQMAVVGSSLGGFYASWVAARTGCRVALLNPAVDPARDLAHYIGEQTNWHDPEERFYFQSAYIDELRVLESPGQPQADKTYLLATKGDEVLDWREMVARYPGATQRVLEGGDHAISDFERWMPEVLAFCEITA